MRLGLACLFAALLLCWPGSCAGGEGYLFGTGKADITGPVADVNLMGYANPTQFAHGIHTRLFARAFIAAEAGDPGRRFVFVNLDACMASQAVTFTVIEKLKERYGGAYHEGNVAMSGTHTHSGPAGYLQYLVYGITSLGFARQTFDALVQGIVEAIVAAHESLAPGRAFVSAGELLGANINRSPTAYLHNPEEERRRYRHDIDKEMALLKILGQDGRGVGAFSWFPVHGTSMNNTNTLVNGDNKGAAAQFMERWARADSEGASLQGGAGAGFAPGFVAAFCQANVGDTSPNTQGAFCTDTGLPCDAVHSTCGGRVEQCIGRGPAWPDHFGSTRIIAQKQADKAQALWAGAAGAAAEAGAEVELSGPVDFRHAFLDMRGLEVAASPHTRAGRTCKPAMGFAFAAGTTDGPGAFDFTQSDTNGTAFWRLVRNFITKPTAEQEACHAPKPILLDVGEMHYPYEWAPYIVEVQILRLGQLLILAVPGELTTMAGRRLRAAVKDTVREAWGDDVRVVIAGLSNTYASYVTTWEEYGAQRYEGGFTLFGRSTLDAYIQEMKRLAAAMVAGEPTDPGPPPPNQLAKQWSLVPPVVADGVPAGAAFGQPSEDVPPGARFAPGQSVSAVFHSACPRNNLRPGGTFLAVERKGEGGAWATVHTDDDWSTRFAWDRPHEFSTLSFATVTWEVPQGAAPGTYRLRHFGDYKHFLGSVYPFEGSSSEFEVVGEPQPGLLAGLFGYWRGVFGYWLGLWRGLSHALGRKAGPSQPSFTAAGR